MCLRSNCYKQPQEKLTSWLWIEAITFFTISPRKLNLVLLNLFLLYFLSLTWTLNLKVLLFDNCTIVFILSQSQYGVGNHVIYFSKMRLHWRSHNRVRPKIILVSTLASKWKNKTRAAYWRFHRSGSLLCCWCCKIIVIAFYLLSSTAC